MMLRRDTLKILATGFALASSASVSVANPFFVGTLNEMKQLIVIDRHLASHPSLSEILPAFNGEYLVSSQDLLWQWSELELHQLIDGVQKVTTLLSTTDTMILTSSLHQKGLRKKQESLFNPLKNILVKDTARKTNVHHAWDMLHSIMSENHPLDCSDFPESYILTEMMR